ncbi:hypothetical protein ACXZ9C_10545 [Streptococcus agalactiae]
MSVGSWSCVALASSSASRSVSVASSSSFRSRGVALVECSMVRSSSGVHGSRLSYSSWCRS